MKGCGVFLDDTHFMVFGGANNESNKAYDDTFILDITANTWSTGPPMTFAHADAGKGKVDMTCNLITDCDGNKKVVIVGGQDGGWNATNEVEIYDVTSQTFSLGKT